MNIPDHISESLETIFLVKKILIFEFFDADPGRKNYYPGSGKNFPDPQHCTVYSTGNLYAARKGFS